VEALHRRPPRQARHARRRRPAPAVHGGHRRRRQDGDRQGRPHAYFAKYGENVWAAVRGLLDATTAAAAAPVIEKYTGVLAAADVFTASTTFWVMESIRLDLGYGSQVQP
jgi:hypothetical protein